MKDAHRQVCSCADTDLCCIDTSASSYLVRAIIATARRPEVEATCFLHTTLNPYCNAKLAETDIVLNSSAPLSNKKLK